MDEKGMYPWFWCQPSGKEIDKYINKEDGWKPRKDNAKYCAVSTWEMTIF